jgi:hypothetical protein
MTQQHPITPPPELVREWYHEANLSGAPYEDSFPNIAYEQHIATRAAQWGADQELEACCALMDDWGLDGEDLMLCRRPKPPSLKEQALEQLDGIRTVFRVSHGGDLVYDIILRALEQLDD